MNRKDLFEERFYGLEMIKAYREHPEKYLPFVDRTGQTPKQNEYGEYNIGWNAGLLEENRPFFAECWAVDQITMLTIYVSAKGIDRESPKELVRRFEDIGYFRFKDEKDGATVRTFHNADGDEFFSINIGVGVEDEPGRIEGAPIYPWKKLNEYNNRKSD